MEPTDELGCCAGISTKYKQGSRCLTKEGKEKYQRSDGCYWAAGAVADCEGTPTTARPGCCAGYSAKANDKCVVKDTEDECSRSSSCHWVSGDDADFSWPGCCFANPETYSARWKSKCVTYLPERECLLLLGNSNGRGVIGSRYRRLSHVAHECSCYGRPRAP